MVLVEDKDYKETLQILRGKMKLSSMYIELKKWMQEQFQITAYNFLFRKIKYNNPENRFELYILLASTSDYSSVQDLGHGYDKNKQEEISRKFYELAREYSFGDEKSIQNVWVCYNDFSVEMKTDVNRQAHKRISKEIKEKYSAYSLWDIFTSFSGVVGFFFKDEDILRNTENGVCKRISDEYFSAIKELDEFNVYNTDNFLMSFDSKENLDKNYEGNLYYYFK